MLRANLARTGLGSVGIWLLLACYLGFALRRSLALWRAFQPLAAMAQSRSGGRSDRVG